LRTITENRKPETYRQLLREPGAERQHLVVVISGGEALPCHRKQAATPTNAVTRSRTPEDSESGSRGCSADLVGRFQSG